jgi:hypothetical protein
MLAGIGLSFVAGFSLAWYVFSSASPQQVTGPRAAPAATAATEAGGMNGFPAPWSKGDPGHVSPAKKASVDDIWASAKSAPDRFQADTDMQEKLLAAAQADPAALRTLIGRLEAERDPAAREMLKSVLSNIPSPEVIALSEKLAVSGNAAQRQDGFEMLKQLSLTSPEVRNLVRQALASEQSPAVLKEAVAALTPTMVAAPEAEAIVAQLNELSRHQDASVRSQSILQMAQWDKTGNAVGRINSALSDPSAEVRQAAVAAIAETASRSEDTKNALMQVVRNANESAEVKDGALFALQRFSLSKAEHELYVQTRAQVDKQLPQ